MGYEEDEELERYQEDEDYWRSVKLEEIRNHEEECQLADEFYNQKWSDDKELKIPSNITTKSVIKDLIISILKYILYMLVIGCGLLIIIYFTS